MATEGGKRKDLSLEQKLDVINALTQKKTQAEVAKEFGISQSQVSRILKNKEDIQEKFMKNGSVSRKRQRVGKSADVEAALLQWFQQMRAKGAPVNGPLLKEKAECFALSLGLQGFEATNGWLHRWKERHSLVYKKLHGESADADHQAADKWREILPSVVEGWSPGNIYNLDETGLYYRAIPDGTYTTKGNHRRLARYSSCFCRY